MPGEVVRSHDVNQKVPGEHQREHAERRRIFRHSATVPPGFAEQEPTQREYDGEGLDTRSA